MTVQRRQSTCDSFTPTGLDELLEVLRDESNRPVLVACLHHSEDWDQLTRELQSTDKHFEGRLLVIVMDCSQEPLAAERLGLLGTPTFLLYAAGREVGRLIGRADSPSLRALVRSVLAAPELDGPDDE